MQTELHRHLDVSLRLRTLLELAQERGLEGQSTSLESFRQKLIIQNPMSSLHSVLAQFTLFQKVLDRPEVLERVAFEAVEDAWNEGTRKIEFRYSPSFVSEYNNLSWKEALSSLRQGIRRALLQYPQIQVGLLCIATRDYGAESVDQTVEFFLQNRDSFVGVDLAGNEDQFPCHLFEKSFKKAVLEKSRITIHAGEASGPENVWEAIELLGAQRIGHGVASIRDPLLVQHLIQNQICLEMCPTSNWLTQAVPNWSNHPLPALLRAGVMVSINTDDPGIFGVTLPHEAEICRLKLGMTQNEIQECWEHASKASFIQN